MAHSDLRTRSVALGFPDLPPITAEEMSTNISQLQTRLNREMKCFAGRNKVYLQSLIGGSRPSRPRVALKCPLRGDIGLRKDVYYEFIRDICCGDPGRCEAARHFLATRSL